MTKTKEIQKLQERIKKERARALHYVGVAEKQKSASEQLSFVTEAIIAEVVIKNGGVMTIPIPTCGKYKLTCVKDVENSTYTLRAEKTEAKG